MVNSTDAMLFVRLPSDAAAEALLGNRLEAGARYRNTGTNVDRVYTGTIWEDAATGGAVVGITALVDAANIATNADDGTVFSVTIAGNRVLDNPTGTLVEGQRYTWIITQDVIGSRQLTYGDKFVFPFGLLPVLGINADSADVITGVVFGGELFMHHEATGLGHVIFWELFKNTVLFSEPFDTWADDFWIAFTRTSIIVENLDAWGDAFWGTFTRTSIIEVAGVDDFDSGWP